MKKSENDYYLNNFKILEQYYINKKNIEENINEKVDINNILFRNKIKGNDIDNNIFQQNHYNQYWKNNNILIHNKNENIQYCINCNNEIDDSICKTCSLINKSLEIQNTYEMKENIRTNYNRLNHMRKIIKQIQGIKSMNISLSVIEQIRKRVDYERINYNELTNTKIKIILKLLKLCKYVEQCTFIFVVFKKKSIHFSDELNERILNTFIKLEKPFSIYIMNANRKNFFNYLFLLNQILIYLGERSIHEFLPDIKNQTHENDEILLFNKLIKEIDV